MSVDLTYCPEGGEHRWEMWYDEDKAKLIIDCDDCHQVAYSEIHYESALRIVPLPVTLEREGENLKVNSRRDV